MDELVRQAILRRTNSSRARVPELLLRISGGELLLFYFLVSKYFLRAPPGYIIITYDRRRISFGDPLLLRLGGVGSPRCSGCRFSCMAHRKDLNCRVSNEHQKKLML